MSNLKVPDDVQIMTDLIGTRTFRYFLLEGDKETLLFLSKLIEDVANSDSDGEQIGPKGAGSALFRKDAKLGLYVYKTGTHKGPPSD